jgi:predicted PurR-regulated permease PerM
MAGLVTAVIVGRILLPILPVLLGGAVLAFLLSPPTNCVQRCLRLPRVLATAAVFGVLLALAASSAGLAGPALVSQVRSLDPASWRLSVRLDRLSETLDSWRYVDVLGTQLDLSPAVDAAQAALEGAETPLLPSPEEVLGSWPRVLQIIVGKAAGLASTIGGIVVAGLLLLTYAFYFVVDLPRISRWLADLIPDEHEPELRELWQRLQGSWRSYLRGQVTLSLLIGTLVSVTNLLIGTPAALVLGILAGVLEVLPGLGPVLAAVPAVAVALVQGSLRFTDMSHLTFGLLVLVMYTLIQIVENNLIVPRVIGGALKLPAIVVLVGVVAGARYAGLMGAFLAAPTIASGLLVGQYALAKFRDQPAYPELVSRKPAAEPRPVSAPRQRRTRRARADAASGGTL